jgi:hypothetical protein
MSRQIESDLVDGRELLNQKEEEITINANLRMASPKTYKVNT